MKLVDDDRLADAGVSREKDQLRPATGSDTMERPDKTLNLAFPSVELFWYQQAVRQVVRAQQEGIDVTSQMPIGEAPSEISLETGGGLVAFLSVLREELHDDRSQRLGDPRTCW